MGLSAPLAKMRAASHTPGWLRIKASSIRVEAVAETPVGTLAGSVAALKLDDPFVENHTAPSKPLAKTFAGLWGWNFTSTKIPVSGDESSNPLCRKMCPARFHVAPPSPLRHSPVAVAASTMLEFCGCTAMRLT